MSSKPAQPEPPKFESATPPAESLVHSRSRRLAKSETRDDDTREPMNIHSKMRRSNHLDSAEVGPIDVEIGE